MSSDYYFFLNSFAFFALPESVAKGTCPSRSPSQYAVSGGGGVADISAFIVINNHINKIKYYYNQIPCK